MSKGIEVQMHNMIPLLVLGEHRLLLHCEHREGQLNTLIF